MRRSILRFGLFSFHEMFPPRLMGEKHSKCTSRYLFYYLVLFFIHSDLKLLLENPSFAYLKVKLIKMLNHNHVNNEQETVNYNNNLK